MRLTARALIPGVGGIALVSPIVAWAELVSGQIMIGLLQMPPVGRRAEVTHLETEPASQPDPVAPRVTGPVRAS